MSRMIFSVREQLALMEMAAEVATQDSRATSDPIYEVRSSPVVTRWDDRRTFFTLKRAQRFVEEGKHRLGPKPHVWVASGHDNYEWRLIRALLIAIDRGDVYLVTREGHDLAAMAIRLRALEATEAAPPVTLEVAALNDAPPPPACPEEDAADRTDWAAS